MPLMVKINVDPNFKPETAAEKAAFSQAKKNGDVRVPYSTALENIKISNGMYRIVQESAAAAPKSFDPDNASDDELKLMLASVGAKLEKGMTRPDAVHIVRSALAEFQFSSDEGAAAKGKQSS